VPVGRKVFLAVVLSQLLSIALIFGWYFYTLRSEISSLTQQRAQDVVLQSIAATEDYFKPAEITVEAGQLLAFGPHTQAGQARLAGTLFFWAASPTAALGGYLCWQSRRRILLCHAQQ
jgi:hypothetical protein